eukprot:scaffold1216_cov357-Prasinococcus_capsulatus_cf.AAC.7
MPLHAGRINFHMATAAVMDMQVHVPAFAMPLSAIWPSRLTLGNADTHASRRPQCSVLPVLL